MLRVVYGSFAPFHYTDDKGNPAGVDIELVKIIAEKMNWKIKWIECPFKRCLVMMKLGQADFQTSLLKKSKREKIIDYLSFPYLTKSTKVFYLRKGDGAKITKYDDLYNLTVGVTTGVAYHNKFDSDSKINKEEVAEPFQNLYKLKSKRFDTFINTEVQADYLIAKLGFSGVFEKSVLKFDKDLFVYMAMSKTSKFNKHKDQIEKILKDLVDANMVDLLLQKHFNNIKKQ